MSLFGPPSPEKLTRRLYKAIKSSDIDAMRALLDAGADANSVEKDRRSYFTPLYACVYYGFADGVALLLEKGASIDLRRSEDGHTPLMEAAQDGAYRIADLLLQAGVDVHAARTDDGKTALHLAAERGRGDVLKLLLRHGAKAEVQDGRMNTPADLADEKHPRLADFLRGVQPGGAKPAAGDGWRLLAADEIAHVGEKPAIGYRMTDIFNFSAKIHTRIVANIQTQAESSSVRTFDEIADSPLLEQAYAAFRACGGDAGLAAVAADKPKLSGPKLSGAPQRSATFRQEG